MSLLPTRFLRSRLLRPVGLAALAIAALQAPAATAAPNLVFVLADDLDSRVVAGMPRLQELARDGTSFSRYFLTSPICTPSRATILTGRYPQNTGVR
jgi:arylsulfatase A-like enzyme